MYDINIKNVKKGKSFFFIFLFVGILFFVVIGFLIYSNYKKLNSLDSKVMSTRVEVNSHVSDGTTMYSPTYYYVVDDVEYVCGSNSSSNVYPSKDNKKVYYDSKDPANCMTEYSKSSNKILFIALLLPIACIVLAIFNNKKINKRIQKINELNQKGKLVKNLQYRLEDTGIVKNNVHIQRPVVEYTLPSGSTITLYGDPRHDNKTCDADGMVDLVIDESNPDNYFIDFEINRLSGNLPTDYYNQGNQNNINQQPVNQVQTDMSYASQPVNQVQTGMSYANQPVSQVQTDMSYATQPVNQVQTGMSYATQPVNQVQTDMSYATQPVNQVQTDMSYATQPVNDVPSLDGFQNNGNQTTNLDYLQQTTQNPNNNQFYN